MKKKWLSCKRDERKPDHILKLEEEQRIALKAFLSGKDVSASLPTGLGKNYGTHHHNTLCPVHQWEEWTAVTN